MLIDSSVFPYGATPHDELNVKIRKSFDFKMAELPNLKPKQVVAALSKSGFYVHHQTGSHAILKSRDGKFRVTVPMHGKDLKKGTLNVHQDILRFVLYGTPVGGDNYNVTNWKGVSVSYTIIDRHITEKGDVMFTLQDTNGKILTREYYD